MSPCDADSLRSVQIQKKPGPVLMDVNKLCATECNTQFPRLKQQHSKFSTWDGCENQLLVITSRAKMLSIEERVIHPLESFRQWNEQGQCHCC